MPPKNRQLAHRLGVTVHESPLRHKLQRLRTGFPSVNAVCLEDWLMDVANARGALVIMRPAATPGFMAPPLAQMSNEELVCGICQFQCLDRPQMLRLAAQLISRGAVEPGRLCQLAKQERVERILAALAREALRVDPQHALWAALWQEFQHTPPLRDVLLHWTRLAEPVMRSNGPNAAAWKLAA